MPIIIPIIVLGISMYLIVAPIIDTPQIEYLYASFFILGGLIFYIPFVYYGVSSPFMGMNFYFFKPVTCYNIFLYKSLNLCLFFFFRPERFTVFCQLLFEVSPTQSIYE